MPPADSSTEDTLDLKLPPEFLALLAEDATGVAGGGDPGTGSAGSQGGQGHQGDRDARGVQGSLAGEDSRDTQGAQDIGAARSRGSRHDPARLLGGIASWAAADTPMGSFRLVPVDPVRHLGLITRWMNDPAVAEFWELAGGPEVTASHLRTQTEGDGRSVPCLGVLDGAPVSYWEIYRADLDPVARYYPARPYDIGVHLLIGGVADRARGLGTALLRAVSDLVLDHRATCRRVIAEPDLRNTPSVSAFLSAGFRLSAEIDLPGKRAALMIRDRALRDRV